MKLTFLGTGTAVQMSKAQSCILIESDVKILVDAGIGAFLRLDEAGVSVNELDAILLTHNHLDHNGDVLAILKARWLEKGEMLPIYGPRGTKEFFESLFEAYPYLRRKLRFEVLEDESFSIGNLQISTIPTYHSIESRAYIIKNGNKSIVISGDTRAFRELMETECNILVHELSLPFGFKAIDHTTPENLAEYLKFCNAERICLTHMYPHAYRIKEEILEYLKKFSNIEIFIAEDMKAFTV
jgi:ribonuclease BN (tRNA processing enzyme)